MGILELGEDITAREKEVLRNIFMEIEEKIRICNPHVKQVIMSKYKKVSPEMKLLFYPGVRTKSHL